jgi:hypothetical protein
MVPPEKPDPTGSTLMFTIDTQTHEILDFGNANQKPDLTKLGLVQTISF